MRYANKRIKSGILLIIILWGCYITKANGDSFPWSQYESRSDAWYRSDECRQIADNVLSNQDDYGSWPKNIDTGSNSFQGDRKDLHGTFDNKATTGEIRFLAKAYSVTEEIRYKDAFIKGLDIILKAQYPTGGWPQHYPPGKGYARHITFNDGAMVRLMELLREIVSTSDYNFVDANRRADAQKAFNRGIECILKCQIRVGEKLKVWCAQHDEKDYSPRPARSYELVSLSGGESAGILRMLMSVNPPTPEIIEAVNAGVQWYHDAKVIDIRIQWIEGKLQAVKDPKAPPLWARFNEIKTNRPFFCDRDGIPKYDYNEIDQERSAGYKWYGDWGKEVFFEYEKWIKRWEHLLLPEGTRIPSIVGDSTVCDYTDGEIC